MFKLQFETNDDCFQGCLEPEVRSVLRMVERLLAQGNTEGAVTDFNGNTIGSFELTED